MSIVSLFSNNIGDFLRGVMVRVLSSSVDECRFDLRSGQSKDNTFNIFGFFTKMKYYYTKETKSQSYTLWLDLLCFWS